jgi:hypothetical protein
VGEGRNDFASRSSARAQTHWILGESYIEHGNESTYIKNEKNALLFLSTSIHNYRYATHIRFGATHIRIGADTNRSQKKTAGASTPKMSLCKSCQLP